MRVIKAGYEVIEEQDVLKKIERVARVCYKSEDKIEKGSDIKMVRSLIKRQHYAMLEHASLAFIVDAKTYEDILTHCLEMGVCEWVDAPYKKNYLRFTESNKRFIISGNLRAWLETLQEFKTRRISLEYGFVYEIGLQTCGLIDFNPGNFKSKKDSYALIRDFTQLTYEERLVHERMSVLFTVDRGVTHELVRHRECSFAQESTRYCNYNLGKFGNEITVIEPCFWGVGSTIQLYKEWFDQCMSAEKSYFRLINMGAIPQEARSVLPSSVKADIAVTAPLDEWQHMFALRACDATGPAHPQMKEVMIPLLKDVQITMPEMFNIPKLELKTEVK